MWPIAYSVARMLGGYVRPRFVEKFLAHSIQRHEFQSLDKLDPFPTREKMWKHISNWIPRDRDVLFLEFGVWGGYSIRHFAALYQSEGARFVGFDSFEGLPDDWEDKKRGHFSTSGGVPQIEDGRVSFVKGWFQNSVEKWLRAYDGNPSEVLVHFDADLYSSTLYLLNALSARFKSYYFVFDEFPGDETRALYNFSQATGSRATFLARTERSMQVFGQLSGQTVFKPD